MLNPGFLSRDRSVAAFQAALVVIALAVLFVHHFTAAAAPDPAAVWIADQKQLKRVDPAVNQYVQAITLSNAAEAIAFDAKSNVLWALANKHLLTFNSTGAPVADFDLTAQAPPADALRRLVLDPYDASLWVAGEKTVLHVNTQGQILLKWTSSQNIQAIGLDPDQSLWVLTQNGLYQLSVAGSVLSNLALPNTLIPDPTFLAVDGLGGYLWVAGKKTLIRLDANDLTKPPLAAALPATVNGTNNKLEALLTHPIFGTVWAVSTDTLLLYDRDASLIRQVGLGPYALGNLQAIAYEPGSASLWLGGKTALGRFTANGDFVTKLPADIAISAMATGPFAVSPTLTLLAPINNSLTNNPRPPFRLGLGAECNGAPCALVDAYTQAFTLDATLNSLAIGPLFTLANREALYIPPTRLPEGPNLFSAQAKDVFGHLSNRVTSQVTIDTIPPTFLSVSPADGSTVSTAQVTISGQVNDPSASVMLRNAAGTVLNVGNATFSFSVTLAQGLNTFTLTAQDPAGNAATVPLRLTYNAAPVLNPSPINPTVATVLSEATKFLYASANPVQTGVNPATIDPRRIAVVRGKVSDRNGVPLSTVNIRVLNHPEFGQTQSRADGVFDLAVNGGGALTIVYEKTGYLPAQRQVNAPWQDYIHADEVILLPVDSKVTTVNLTLPTLQVAQGNVVTDSDGTRQATVFFPPGTAATMVKPDGTTQPLTTLNVRVTEYTVGPNGPKAMPAPLPPTSAYTYAVELSVDEALAVNAKTVVFNQPVPFYVDNFLNFPVGGIVPVGYYDRDKGVWVPSNNGKVIKILSIAGGLATLDTNGDGAADTAAQLAALGITDAERGQLASLYSAGKTLWRVPITHFTPWDCNWPYGPPPGAEPPKQPPFPPGGDDDDEPNKECSSVIECQNQVLGESVNLTGTPFSLNYRSSRVLGRKSANTVKIPLSGASVPAPLKRIDLEISVGGRQFFNTFPASPNQKYAFTWDGKDAYGRSVQGSQPLTIRVGYVYDAVYMPPAQVAQSFAAATASGTPLTGNRARNELTLWQQMQSSVGVWDARTQGVGAWTLDVQHAYDPSGQILYLGSGGRRSAQNISPTITTMSLLSSPRGVAVDATGTIFIAETFNGRIRKVTPDGIVTTVVGTGLDRPLGVAVDATGTLFISDYGNGRVRKVTPDGIITTVAGNGSYGFNGDGGPATAAALSGPHGVVVDAAGTLFIADHGNGRIRKVTPDGIITTVAGNGIYGGFGGDGGPATAAQLSAPGGIAVDAQGNLFIADIYNQRVRKVTPDGIITTTVASSLSFPWEVAVDATGTLFIADPGSHRILKVTPDGIITTVAGIGLPGFSGDGGPATAAALRGPYGVAVDAAGMLFIVDNGNGRLRKVSPVLSSFSGSEVAVSSTDGSEVYRFNASGRHLQTLNTLTGAVRYTFGYNANGYLIQIADGDGNVTTIDRSGDVPTAIIAPDGQRTGLSLDANGYLAAIANPAGETTQITYTPDGLLTHFTTPRGHTSVMTYDAGGRLIRDDNPAGGFWALSRTEADRTYEVSLTSALGRQTRYHVERLTTEDRRYTNTYPDGSRSIVLKKTDGTTNTTNPDGTLTSTIEGPDPRFGMQSPIVKSGAITLPSGLSAAISRNRTATLADPANLLSLTSQTDTFTVNGKTATNLYTASTRQNTFTTPTGRQALTTTDTQGRPNQVQIAGLAPLIVGYDPRGRLSALSQTDGSVTRSLNLGYNLQGYVNAVTDPLGRNYGFSYDQAGRLTTQTLPDGRIITWSYDANGNVVGITPPNKPIHSFAYTPVDLEERYTPPSAGLPVSHTQYAYNLDKQLTTVTRPDGQTVNLSYNSAGKLTTLTLPTGTVTSGYSATTGKLTSINTSQGVGLSYTHDGFLPVTETYGGPVAGSVTRTYNTDFQVTGVSVNGTNIPVVYDNDGLLTQTGSLALARSAQNGLITGTALGNVSTSQTYNGFGDVNQFTALQGGTSLLAVQYTRDKLGRITEKTETVSGQTATYTYAYDQTGRLIEATKNGIATAYTYDANGNRLPGTYDDQDRLLSYGTNTYTYTANGELKTRITGTQTTTYTYDVLGNLTNVVLSNGTVLDYVIDGRNRRIGKKVNGTLTQGFLYQDQLKPVAELDGVGVVVSRFVYGEKPNVPEYFTKGGNTYRIISDHLGSPRLVINTSTGVIEQRLDYDEFGNVTNDTNPGFQPFGFAGGLYDRDTKLVRFGARDYGPETGRWITKDPILFGGGNTNLYGYIFNDPINHIDPSGLVETWDPGEIDEELTPQEKCYSRCTAKAFAGPFGGLIFEETAVLTAEHYLAKPLARTYYSYRYPTWFSAGGQFSTVMVPSLAERLANVGKGISILGLGYFGYKMYDCAKECDEKSKCSAEK